MDLKGKIYLTCDANKLPQLLQIQNTKIVSISDSIDPNFAKSFGMVGASILVPPYQIMMIYAEGNIPQFQMEYLSYLQSGPAAEYVAAILKALLTGVNIVLYTSQDDIGAFGGPIQGYFGEMFGISVLNIDDNSIPFIQDNPNKYATVLNHMYYFTTLSSVEFVQLYPIDTIPLNETVLHKLIVDFKPAVPEPSCDKYRDYFNKYIHALQHHSTSLKEPVLFGV